MLNRNQWVGFSGAPTSQALNLNAPFRSRNIGFGVAIMNDKIGPLSKTTIDINFAYKIKTAKQGSLSLGIKGGGDFNRGGLDLLSTIAENDPSLLAASTSFFLPNFGAGIYYKNKKTFFSFSIPRLLNHQSTNYNNYALKKHYYFIVGSEYNLVKSVIYKPTILVRYVINAPTQIEITNRFQFQKKYEFGLALRTTDAVAILLGIDLFKNLKLVYSFDWSFGNRSFVYNQGSHEVYLNFKISPRKQIEIITPRYL